MIRLLALIVGLLAIVPYVHAKEQTPLPPFSADRYFEIVSVVNRAKFPILIRELCEKLGGDTSVRWASYRYPVGSHDGYAIYFNVSEDKKDEGVFQLELTAVQQEGDMADWMCTDAQLLYLREGISFYARLRKEPNSERSTLNQRTTRGK